MKIAQISDIHISQNPKDRLFGLVNAEDTFIDVLQAVKQETPDLVIATGDLSQDGSAESYQRLQKHLNTINCQVYAIYGNHDNPENFDRWLIGGNVAKIPTLETKMGTLVFLSSYKAGADSGYIDAANLAHLETSLNNYQNCIPIIHHHFVPLGTVVDRYILENTTELATILTAYTSKIKFCVTGHVHNTYIAELAGIKVYSSLSTCVQFAKTQSLFFENKRPGYTIYNFQGDSYAVIEKTI